MVSTNLLAYYNITASCLKVQSSKNVESSLLYLLLLVFIGVSCIRMASMVLTTTCKSCKNVPITCQMYFFPFLNSAMKVLVGSKKTSLFHVLGKGGVRCIMVVPRCFVYKSHGSFFCILWLCEVNLVPALTSSTFIATMVCLLLISFKQIVLKNINLRVFRSWCSLPECPC